MVVVVPSLSKGDEGEDEAVLAVVARLESSLADDVREGIDAERAVIQQRCADAEAPCEHLKRVGSKTRIVGLKVSTKEGDRDSKQDRRKDVQLLKEYKLRKLGQILYEFPTGLNKLGAQNPTNVRPP